MEKTKKNGLLNKKINIETYIILLIIIFALITTITLVIIRNIKVANDRYNREMEELYLGNNRAERVSNLKVRDEYKNVDNFILYNGVEISKDICTQTLSNMKNTDSNKEKYNIKYYTYNGNIYKGERKGKIRELDNNEIVVEDVNELAFSKYYEVIARSCDIKEKLPDELLEKQEYLKNAKKVSVMESDVDGEGNLEYIVAYERDDLYSEIILFNSEFSKIATLVTLENSYWNNIKSEENRKPLTLSDVYCLDLNEDGIMEIMYKVPTYSGTTLNTIRVIDGEVEGKTDIKASLIK